MSAVGEALRSGQPTVLLLGARAHRLTDATSDVTAALEALVALLGAGDVPVPVQEAARPQPPVGPLTAELVCQAIGATLPERAIVSDESQTSGLFLPAATAGAPRHDLLCLTGGAIGQGLPVAVRSALPSRPGADILLLRAAPTTHVNWGCSRSPATGTTRSSS